MEFSCPFKECGRKFDMKEKFNEHMIRRHPEIVRQKQQIIKQANEGTILPRILNLRSNSKTKKIIFQNKNRLKYNSKEKQYASNLCMEIGQKKKTYKDENIESLVQNKTKYIKDLPQLKYNKQNSKKQIKLNFYQYQIQQNNNLIKTKNSEQLTQSCFLHLEQKIKKFVPQFKKIQYLNISRNNLQAIQLEGLQGIRQIVLIHNHLTSLKFLQFTDNSLLRKVYLDYNNINKIGCKNVPIKLLSIPFNKLQIDSVVEFKQFPKLTYLDVSFNPLRKQTCSKWQILIHTNLEILDGIVI